MGKIWEILGGPVTGVIDSVGTIIDDLNTSDEEKLQAKLALETLEANLRQKVMEADAELAKQQAKVLQTEIASQSWMGRNWRPILMLVFTYIIAHNFVVAPIFSVPVVEIPQDMWGLIKIGVGGYVFGRTVEKTAPEIVRLRSTQND